MDQYRRRRCLEGGARSVVVVSRRIIRQVIRHEGGLDVVVATPRVFVPHVTVCATVVVGGPDHGPGLCPAGSGQHHGGEGGPGRGRRV